MAKRENPELSGTRIIQPVASPVDTFVQPVLRRPAENEGLQIARALGPLSSSLSGLGEEMLQEKREEELAAGAQMDLSGATPGKLAELEEKAKGILPWRYQAALKGYGQDRARSYKARALAAVPELSSLNNPQGEPLTEEQVSEQLNAMWEESAGDVKGYFARAGAMEEKARVDSEFYNQWAQSRRANIIKDNNERLASSVLEALDEDPEVFSQITDIEAIQEAWRSSGFGPGRDVILTTVFSWIDTELKTADSDTAFDQYRALLATLEENGLGGQPLPAGDLLNLEKVYEAIDEAEINAVSVDSERRAKLANAVFNNLYGTVADMIQNQVAAGGGFASLSLASAQELVDGVLSQYEGAENLDEIVYRTVRSRLVDYARAQARNSNTPGAENTKLIGEIRSRADTASFEELDVLENLAREALENGDISPSSYGSIMEQIKGNRAVGLELSSRGSQAGKSADKIALSEVLPGIEGISDELQRQVESLYAAYDRETNSLVMAELREIRSKGTEGGAVGMQAQMQAAASRIRVERAAEFRKTHLEMVTMENLYTGAGAAIGSVSSDISATANSLYPVSTSLDTMTDPAPESRANNLRLQSSLRNGLRAYYLSIDAPTITERNRTFEVGYLDVLADLLEEEQARLAPTPEAGPESVLNISDNPNYTNMPNQFRESVRAAQAAAIQRDIDPSSRNEVALIDALNRTKDNASSRLQRLRELGASSLSVVDMAGNAAPVEDQFVFSPFGVHNAEKFSRGTAGLDFEVTRNYLYDLVNSGELDSEMVVDGVTPDGVDLRYVIGFADWQLNPLVVPMFRDQQDFNTALGEAGFRLRNGELAYPDEPKAGAFKILFDVVKRRTENSSMTFEEFVQSQSNAMDLSLRFGIDKPTRRMENSNG
jgi:hypothetical protein